MARTKVLKEVGTGSALTGALVGWLVPGAGHALLGRFGRALILGGVVWALFFYGVHLNGHFYSFFDEDGGLLSRVFAFCNVGTGLIYLVARSLGVAVVERAEFATAEYGNVFLMIAGLVNYLLALDAYDLGAGRKS